MKRCSFCGKFYSDTLRRCPRCGSFSRSNHWPILKWLRDALYLLLMIGFLGLLMWLVNEWQ